MKTIDAHAHVFMRFAGISDGAPVTSAEHGRIKTGNRYEQALPPSFRDSASPADTLLAYMDWCGVGGALLMPNVFYGYHNEYNAKAVRDWPDRFRALALVDVIKGERAARELERLVHCDGFVGLKIETNSAFQCAPDTTLDGAALAPVWAVCDALGLPVCVHPAKPRELHALARLADTYPNVRIVVCHFGAEAALSGWPEDRREADWLLDAAARTPKMYLETSSLPYFLGRSPAPAQAARELILEACKRVGAAKVLWGSDYPGMLLRYTYPQLIALGEDACASLTARERELVMYDNARSLFWKEENNDRL